VSHVRCIDSSTGTAVLLLACVVAVAGPASALPQDPAGGTASPTTPVDEDPLAEAGRRFDQGVAYVAEGRFEAAMAEFLRAYEISGEWIVLYNLGQVSASLGRNADAYDYFTRYLAAGGDEVESTRRGEVEGALRELEPRVAHLAIDADIAGAVVFVDGKERGATPLLGPVVVEPGSHVVEVRDERLAGGRERREIILAGGLTETVHVAAAAPVGPPPTVPETPEEEESIASAWWFWTIIGAVVVGGGVTAGVLLWPDESGGRTTYTEGTLPPIVLGAGAP
jgi:hypothetical protein